MSIALQAAADQNSRGYAVDTWIDITLPPMHKLWQGVGGKRSPFFVSEEDARMATGAYEGTTPYKFAETLWRLAQAAPNPDHGFRDAIEEFVVNIPTPAAVGFCIASRHLGIGSVFQYFIPGDWEGDNRILATGRTYKFPAKARSPL